MAETAPSSPLAGKGALVTGAAIRVGRAIALALAQAGADVAVHYRSSKADADAVVEEIRALGRRALAIQADLAIPEECARTVRDAVRALGGLDFLVHSAASFQRALLADTDAKLWDSTMNVNARSGFLLAREAAPMLKERGGRVVLISDFLARDPVKNYLVHCVSKAAVEGLTRALAVELAPEITVNAVAPGTVLLPEGTPPEEGEKLARRLPLKRYGDPEDVARTVVFLCSGPSFLTGQVIRVDGGRSLT
jgi:pteridine reductase